jgi:hypothetical protein
MGFVRLNKSPTLSKTPMVKFAKLNRINSSKMLFGLVYENVFGTDC